MTNEHDAYSTISATAQMSNERNTVSASYYSQNYTNIVANNNNTISLNWTYHQTKKHDYTLIFFKQVYPKTPSNLTDTSSSNQGFKFVSSWYKTFSNTQSGYLNLAFSYLNYYTSNTGRKDETLDISSGLQTYLGKFFTFTPSFSTNYLKSNDSYYEYYSLGPAIYFSYYPTEKLVFYTSDSYLFTGYSKRIFTLTSITGKAVNATEKQTLVIIDFGIIYNLTKNIPFQVIYSTTRNSSNYAYRDYKLSITSASISFNF
jgi:hypothetical protein